MLVDDYVLINKNNCGDTRSYFHRVTSSVHHPGTLPPMVNDTVVSRPAFDPSKPCHYYHGTF